MDEDIFDLPRQEHFDSLGNDYDLWTHKSFALFRSAKAIESACGRVPRDQKDVQEVLEWVEMHGVSRMLRGMAFECLFKALWLAYGGTLADKGKYLGIPGARDHDLCSLEGKVAERVDTGLNSKERRLLARLSFFIMYGRYPIRKSMSEQYPSTPDSDKPVYWCRWTPEDDRVLEEVTNKLQQLIKK